MEWIKVSELAKIKGVTERAVRKSIKNGKYEARKSCITDYAKETKRNLFKEYK